MYKEKVTNLNSPKKMKPQNILCLLILLAFRSNMIITSCFAQSDSKIQRPFSPWEIVIWNHMKDSTLLAHCKSKDNDLGEHEIGLGEKYSWTFKENFWQSTRFWCNFSSKQGHTSGEVFWPEMENWFTDQCYNSICTWTAEDNGISLRLGSKEPYLLEYPWK